MKLLMIVLLVVTSQAEELRPRVNTKYGPVVGRTKTTENGITRFQFKGIPYAKAPTGALRFKPPVPPEPWTEELDAIKDDILCIQYRYGKKLAGVEDCLLVNIATTQLPDENSERLPVMVFIHGGGFTSGSSNKPYLPETDYLVEKKVVVVTFLYRLGPMGFISTEDSSAPGNYGLLDQIAALQWVQENIHCFGGDPASVTIFGISAGGASVQYLMFSPLAKGLFHRAISQSGSIFSPWSFTRRSKKASLRLGELLGCPTNDSEQMIECLRNKDAGEILETSDKQRESVFALIPMLWVPRVDIESDNPVLPRNPMDIMKSGGYNKVPWIAGHVKDEGAHYLGEAHFKELTDHWNATCKKFFYGEEFDVAESKVNSICDKIYETYLLGEEDENKRRLRYIEIIGHLWFVAGIHRSVEVMSTHHPVYYYNFAYESENVSLTSIRHPYIPKRKGLVSHADDKLYFFNFPETNWTTSSPEYKQIDIMTSLWSSFARTGVPSYMEQGIDWPESQPPHFSYLRFDQNTTIGDYFQKMEMDTWKEILKDNWFMSSTETKHEL